MKLFLITMVNSKIGAGHYFRTLRLTQYIKDTDHYQILVICNEKKNFSNLFENKKIKIFDNFKDAVKIVNLIYFLDYKVYFDIPNKFYDNISLFNKKSRCIFSMNMFKEKREIYHEDISIVPEFSTIKKMNLSTNCTEYSGTDFIALPKEFFALSKRRSMRVLVTMGAADPENFTNKVIKSIEYIQRKDLNFDIILPNKNVNVCQIKNKYITLHKFGSIDFAAALKEAQFAIINGGMTRYECIASRTYFIALSLHKRQYEITKKVTDHGFGLNLGFCPNIRIKDISNAIDALSSSLMLPESQINLSLNRNKKIMNIISEFTK